MTAAAVFFLRVFAWVLCANVLAHWLGIDLSWQVITLVITMEFVSKVLEKFGQRWDA